LHVARSAVGRMRYSVMIGERGIEIRACLKADEGLRVRVLRRASRKWTMATRASLSFSYATSAPKAAPLVVSRSRHHDLWAVT